MLKRKEQNRNTKETADVAPGDLENNKGVSRDKGKAAMSMDGECGDERKEG